jgi:FkbM family methyltransferase
VTAARGIGYTSRRVVQTPRTFRNWPALLSSLAAEKVHRGAPTLTFHTRSGLRLQAPNVPGARLPLYEQFADDVYRLAWVLGPGTDPVRILDVGAHVGAFATNVASARAGVAVECYEPSPSTAEFLRGNVEANGLDDRIRVHEAAIAATAGTAALDDNSSGSVHNGLVGEAGRLVNGDDSAGHRHVIQVKTVSFDAAAEAGGPFDVVKMDCEGGEYALVYASDKRHWASVQRVVMEYHPVAGESWDELRAWFEGVGLRVMRDETDPHAPGLGLAWLERATG